MTRTLLLLVLLAPFALPACRSIHQPADPKLAAQLSKLPYPKAAALGPDLDIVLVQQGKSFTLTNRTARSYHDVQLWLNQQYVAKLDRVDIGASPRLDLKNFVNEYGESFPVSRFLKPERGQPVLLAELFEPASGKRYRLLVQMKESLTR